MKDLTVLFGKKEDKQIYSRVSTVPKMGYLDLRVGFYLWSGTVKQLRPQADVFQDHGKNTARQVDLFLYVEIPEVNHF